MGLRLPLLGIVCALAALVLAAPLGAQTGPQTIVSLTFDDGPEDNYSAGAPILAKHGMLGTFYVNTNKVGTPGFMSWAQLQQLNAAGHEIAGHTLDHLDLFTLGDAEARRQVCDDRAALLARGFVATSFAYPYGNYWDREKAIVQECGYSSGRAAWGLRNPELANDTRPYAENPSSYDRYAVRTMCCIVSTTTAETLKDYIRQAELAGGGWVPLNFHSICDGCANWSTPPAVLDEFLEWLKARAAQGTIVRTTTQVVSGDAAPPSSSISCNGSTCSTGWYASATSVSLGATDAGGTGVARIRYTLDGSEPTVASPTYVSPFTVSQTATVRFRAWDNAGNVETTRSQLIRIDATAPTSSILCNGAACAGSAYSSSVAVSLSATDSGGSGVAVIRYTLDGSEPTASSTAYSSPFTVSQTTTVRYRAWDNAGNVEATKSQLVQIAAAPPGDTEPPVSSIACNGATCVDGWYAPGVQVSLSATDSGGSGVAVIRYTLDGSEPTASSTAYSSPFTVSQTTTVRYRAWDNAGNVEATKSQLIRIDAVAPTVAIVSPRDGDSFRKGSIRIAAEASDAGSGVVVVEFYANGALIGTRSSAPYSINWNPNKLPAGQYTLTAIARDAAGNAATSAPVGIRIG